VSTETVDPPRVVLVTGASRFLGGSIAARLAGHPSVERVIAVDTEPPPTGAFRTERATTTVEFVRADIRNPLIAKVIASAGVDTVVHAALSASPGRSGGRSTMKEMNVIGSMQLLAACQGAPTVRRMVVKSTTAVYGSRSRDPAVFTEKMEPKATTGGGYAKDSAEIEGYVRGFARRRPDVSVTVLRFANVVGPRMDTALTRYFSLPLVPTVLGFDARVQLLHEEDALAVLELACTAPAATLNVPAADGVLLLSQAIRRAGRIPVPVPAQLTPTLARFVRGARLVDFTPEQVQFLNFGRVVDTSALTRALGFRPRWTTQQAFDDFVTARGLRPVLDPARVRAVEQRAVALAGVLP
jgi:UDP-glucose 4-epimerase